MKLRLLLSLTALFVTALNHNAYGQLKNISVISYEIVSYNVFTEKMTVNLTLKNDSSDLTIKSITGLVYKNRSRLVTVTAANLYVPHGESTIGIVCNVSRCTSVSVFDLVRCYFSFNIKDYSADLSAAIQYPLGDIQYKEQKNIVLSSFLKFQ